MVRNIKTAVHPPTSRLYRITSKDIIADLLSLGKRMWRKMPYDSERKSEE